MGVPTDEKSKQTNDILLTLVISRNIETRAGRSLSRFAIYYTHLCSLFSYLLATDGNNGDFGLILGPLRKKEENFAGREYHTTNSF